MSFVSETQPTLQYNNYLNKTLKTGAREENITIEKSKSNPFGIISSSRTKNFQKTLDEDSISKLERDMYTKLGFPSLLPTSESFFQTPPRKVNEEAKIIPDVTTNIGELSTFSKTQPQRVKSSPIKVKKVSDFRKAVKQQEVIMEYQRSQIDSEKVKNDTLESESGRPEFAPRDVNEKGKVVEKAVEQPKPNKKALATLEKILNSKKFFKKASLTCETTGELFIEGNSQLKNFQTANSEEKIITKIDKRLESIEQRILGLESGRKSPHKKNSSNVTNNIESPNMTQSFSNVKLKESRITDIEDFLMEKIQMHDEILDVSEGDQFETLDTCDQMYEEFTQDTQLEFLTFKKHPTKTIKIGKNIQFD